MTTPPPIGYFDRFTDTSGVTTCTLPTDDYQASEEQDYRRPRAQKFDSYSFSFSQAGIVVTEDGQVAIRASIWIDPTSASTVMVAQTTFDALVADLREIGQGKLWMALPDGSTRWCTAEVDGRPSYALDDTSPYGNLLCSIKLTKLSDWYGSALTTLVASISGGAFTLVNPGTVRNEGKEGALTIQIQSGAGGAGGGWTNPLVLSCVLPAMSITLAQASASINDRIDIVCARGLESARYWNGSVWTSLWAAGTATIPNTQSNFPHLPRSTSSWTISGRVNCTVSFLFYPAFG